MAGPRPPHVQAPDHLSKSPPLPEAEPAREGSGREGQPETGGPKGHEPTRYGDWENKGIAWDF